jgi:hypothetical protein
MARLWFSVIGVPNQGITVRVHHGNRYEEQPTILEKIKELINTGKRSSLANPCTRISARFKGY